MRTFFAGLLLLLCAAAAVAYSSLFIVHQNKQAIVLTFGYPAHEIVGRGIALAPEGRHCFPRMTVRENLMLGAHPRRARHSERRNLDMVLDVPMPMASGSAIRRPSNELCTTC